jgi:hypothetical protein
MNKMGLAAVIASVVLLRGDSTSSSVQEPSDPASFKQFTSFKQEYLFEGKKTVLESFGKSGVQWMIYEPDGTLARCFDFEGDGSLDAMNIGKDRWVKMYSKSDLKVAEYQDRFDRFLSEN